MNLTRILSAVIGFPIVVAILVLGNTYVIDIVFSIVAVISIYEYFKAVGNEYKPIKWIGYIAAVFIAFIHIIPINILNKIYIFIIPAFIVVSFMKIVFSNMKTEPKDIFATLFGICYIIGFIIFIPMLYSVTNGKFLIWYIFIIAWGTDTFAYAVGRRIGKHKLSKISPKKSIEGSTGGIIGAVVLSVLYTFIIQRYVDLNLSYIVIGLIAFVLSILSQIGDLSASSIKRSMNIKDFGNLLPGHGGMLDRIDSIIFIAPFAYFLLTII